MKGRYLILIFFTSNLFAEADDWSLSGRIELDALSVLNDDNLNLSSDYDIRRARLSAFKKLNDHWSFYAQSDFKNTENDLQLLWLRFKPSKNTAFKLGKVAQPFGFDNYSSSETNLFMERALPSVFLPYSGIGLSYHKRFEIVNLDMALLGEDHLNLNGDPDFGRAVVIRIHDRFKIKDSNLYWAVSYANLKPDGNLRIRGNQEATLLSHRLIDSGLLINPGTVNTTAISLLWKKHSWHLQSEITNSEYALPGQVRFYANGGFISLGKTFNMRRKFSNKSGQWNSHKVKPGHSWEIGLRHSYLNLNDDPFFGGVISNTSIGINYYFNNNSRMMLNFISIKGAPEYTGLNRSISLVQARLQIGF